MLPVVWMYKTVVGSMDGCMLFFRLLFVCCRTAIAVFSYRTLDKQYGTRASLFSAALLLVFAPFSIAAFSYNTLGMQFTLLACLPMISFKQEVADSHRLFRAGVWLGLTVMS